MSGIQFFEAQIGDQLLPRAAYDNLLARHGFTDIGSHPLTPMHALTYGRNPRSPSDRLLTVDKRTHQAQEVRHGY